jgi:hypothetical protein
MAAVLASTNLTFDNDVNVLLGLCAPAIPAV